MADIPDSKDAGKRGNISDYLQMPKKKRKNYIVLGFREGFDEDILATIRAFVKQQYPNHAIAEPNNIEELQKQFGRNITILLLDDEMSEMEEVITTVLDLKVKRKSEKIPVLFFTRNAKELIEKYHEKLLPFHEVDEYLVFPKMHRNEILGRIKMSIEQQTKRKSRRYAVNFPVSFHHLNTGKSETGRIIDISVHGAKIKASKDFIFNDGDQIKLHMPIGNFMKHDEGDYLKVSAKVRRVLMSGNSAAISFEHLSEHQFLRLTMFVTGLVNQQMLLAQKSVKSAATG
jgi:hypothetical protein